MEEIRKRSQWLRGGDSEENHLGSQDLYRTSLHSVTVSSVPCVEAVIPKDEMN